MNTKQIIKEEYCYWCGKKATSREHVPPKCLFPERKDIKEIYDENFRKNLITVPSCDEHNMQKSNDDEYLLACLAGRVGNNGVAYVHNSTKVKRARERNTKLVDVKKEAFITIGQKKYPVQIVQTDNLRLAHSFEAIGRALYFHEYNKILDGKCKIISDMFLDYNRQKEDNEMTLFLELLKKEQPQWNTSIKGENQDVFAYQISPIDDLGGGAIYLRFYKRTEVYVVFMEEREKYLQGYEKERYKKAIDALKLFVGQK